MNATEMKPILEQFTVLERAVLYARVSGDDTRQEGRNITGQLRMGKEYAIQKGYKIIAELSEDKKKNTSGADWDLPKLNEALEMARNGEFEVLIVRELDRFARDLAKQLVVESQFKSYGVRIEYVLGEYPNTPEGNLNKNIKAVIAEYERLKTRERMVRGKNQVALSGKVIASDRVPYGYRLSEDHTTFLICPDEAEIVKLIFDLYVQEKLSIRAIATRLSELKIPTAADKHSRIRKKRGIGQWSPSTVRKVLTKKTYTGVWTYNKESKSKIGKSAQISVPVPIIISQETFKLAQERLAHNQNDVRQETKYDFMLNRHCKCGLCQAKAGCQPCDRGKRLYYCCQAMFKNRRPYKCNLKKMFNARKVDFAVWQWLRKLLEDPLAVTQALQEARDRQNVAITPLVNRLNTVDNLLGQYENELTKKLDTLNALEENDSQRAKAKILKDIAQIESTLDSLEAERAKLVSQIESQQTLTDEAIERIQTFALKIGKGLVKADDNIKLRREAMETFNVEVTLTEEDEQQVFYATCMLQIEAERFVVDPDIGLSGALWYIEV